MLDFLADYNTNTKELVNDAFFKRTIDKPLWQHVLYSIQALDVLPSLEILGYELIEDQTKINVLLNKKNIKDKKIKNNKQILELNNINETIYDMLKVKFRITANGETEDVVRSVLIPRLIDKYYFMINGKKTLPLVQCINNSTFMNKKSMLLKTALFPIQLNINIRTVKFTNGETIKSNYFQLNLFKAEPNPLLFYLAVQDIEDVIEYFNLGNVINLTTTPRDEKNYFYIKTPKLYIEIHKKASTKNPFVMEFATNLYNALEKENNIKEIYDRRYWLAKLGGVYGKAIDTKGKKVLISFNKVLDQNTRDHLKVKNYHKQDTHSLIRWMMTNYHELKKKDDFDLKNSRLRIYESIAHNFDAYLVTNVHSLLNTDGKVELSRMRKLLNSITHFSFIRSLRGSNPYPLFRYEKYNDLDAIDLGRYSKKGPSGIKGGKYKTAPVYRDIYPSHLGRIDVNVCSANDPGLTGFITANVTLYDGTYFSDELEPDIYDKQMKEIRKLVVSDEEFERIRKDMINLEICTNEDGLIVLGKKGKHLYEDVKKNPEAHGLFDVGDGYILIPKYQLNQDGLIVLQRKTNNDLIVLEKKKTKTAPTQDFHTAIEEDDDFYIEEE